LNTFGEKLKNKFVKLYSDNQNVIRISKIGMKPLLQSLAFSIYKNCLEHNIELSIAWVPREYINVEAEFLSKIFDFDDWGISDKIFSFFRKLWGPFTCDVFANSDNHKVDKFYSQFWTPGTAGVDAFAIRLVYIFELVCTTSAPC
jgi:hypothetical protein